MRFREIARATKAIPHEECIELLRVEKRGVLSVHGDDGYPYGMPMNHYYCESDGCIYFHCGRRGHRLDSIARSDKVSYCVTERGTRKDDEWAYEVRSVIAFGRASVVDDLETVKEITRALCHKFTDDEEYIEGEISRFASATILIRLGVEHLTGKRVTES